MKLFAIALTAFLLPFAAQSRDIDPGPTADDKIAPPAKEVSITLASSDEKELTIRVTNATAKPFVYSGYSPVSPIFQIKEHPVGWCGTGVRQHTLEPGRSFTFKIHRSMIRDPKTDNIHVKIGEVMSAPVPLK